MHSVCQAVSTASVAVILVSVVVTLVAYGATVWPATLASALRRPSLFYLPGDADSTAAPYLAGLRTLDVPAALADEALKLAFLRRIKATRTRVALVCTLVSYAILTVLVLTGGQCAR